MRVWTWVVVVGRTQIEDVSFSGKADNLVMDQMGGRKKEKMTDFEQRW